MTRLLITAALITRWHKLIAWPEGITTWAILLTLGAITWQAVETRRAARATMIQASVATKAMIVQFRPRIQIRAIHLYETNHALIVEIVLANKGDTPGHISEGSVKLSFMYTHTPDYSEVSSSVFQPVTLAPGEDAPLKIDMSESWVIFRLAANDVDNGKPQSIYLRCEGEIHYADDNGAVRKTGFRRTYDLNSGRFVSDVSDPEYEYAD